MSIKTSVKDNQENPRFTVCLDQPSFKNDVENNPDLFLAASMQFLHRLLAERTSQYTKLEANGIPTAESQVQDVQQQGNNTARQLYFEQIDQIEEYKRQLHNMENFFSTIQFNTEKPASNYTDCDAVVLEETIDVRRGEDMQNLESKKVHDNSYCSNYPYSVLNYDQSSVDTSQLHKINIPGTKGPASTGLTVRKTVPDKSDLTSHFQTQSVSPRWTSLKNNSIQNSTSYADIVRNAVSGLARNCGKKYKSRRNRDANSWLREAEIMKRPEEIRHQREFQNESEYEISSESQAGDGQGSDILKQIPIRVQLATESDSSPRKPVTLLVRVPNAVFNLLNRKVSKEDTKILSPDPMAKVNTEPGKRKKRITSVFRNFLKGRRSPSSTTVYSATEKLQNRVALALAENFNDEEDQGNDINRNTLIYTLKKSASCDSFELKRIKPEISYEAINEPTIEPRNTKRTSLKRVLVPPTKSVNGYEKISLNLSPGVISSETEPWNGEAAGIVRRKLVDDKAMRTEVPSNKTKIVKGLTNYRDEKIIPLRCSEGSPQLGNKCGEISQRDVDIFLKLAKEMRKFQVYNRDDANWKHVEIPVEIKTTETSLRLQKTENEVSTDFLDHHVFQPEPKISQTTASGIETQQFLEMLVESLTGDAYLPSTEYTESQELSSSFNSVGNKPQENFKLTKNSVDSALEVLLRHIGTSTSIMSCTKPYAAEKDTTVQTAPKRQLSKISVCYSSESLSGSEQETPEVEMKDSTISKDEYRVCNHVLSKESKKINKQQYFHHYETIEQDYTDSYENDKVVYPDKSEDIYAGVKTQSCMDSGKITKDDNSNPNLSPFSTETRRLELPPCIRTEVIIEEQNYDTIEAGVKAQGIMNRESTSLSIRDTEKTVFCHPTVLSKQIFGDNKELADAMIRWWGPQINYSTTPSSQTQLSTYSVSINNLI